MTENTSNLGVGWEFKGWQGGITNGDEETSGSDGCIHYFDCGNDVT